MMILYDLIIEMGWFDSVIIWREDILGVVLLEPLEWFNILDKMGYRDWQILAQAGTKVPLYMAK